MKIVIGGCETRIEVCMSCMNLFMLMKFMQRKKCWVSGGGVGGEMERDVNMGKWSEGEMSECVIDGSSVESLVVMTRSRMWPCWCVGNETCWVRLEFSRSDKNCCVRRLERLSMWRLKSPVMIKSCGVVAAVALRMCRSARKSENGTGSWEFLDGVLDFLDVLGG